MAEQEVQKDLEESGGVLGNQEAVDASTNEGVKIEGEKPAQSTKWESQARASGWVPLEEWDGDPDDWTDAKEFVRRGELFHKISNQSSEIKELKKAISALTDHHQKVKETEYTRALEYLKQQKKTALEEGDADKLLQVDDAIDILKQERQQEAEKVQQQKQSGPTPVFTSWVQQNPWYLKDPELRSFADEIGVGAFQRAGGNIAEQELYELVRQRVMKAYPEKFKGNGNKTPAVEGSGNSGAPAKADSFRLSEEEERVMKTFVRQGIMSKEQYIADLKKVKGLS
ncbi:MAG: hypothetical protein VKL39_22055 [Leptolyngbyaceae bacterium]|nr:hypothetical protein [Leptolyngbyaceae bacterium]